MVMTSATNAMLAIKIINGKSENVQCSLNACNWLQELYKKGRFLQISYRFGYRAFHELLCPEVEKSWKKKIKSVQ